MLFYLIFHVCLQLYVAGYQKKSVAQTTGELYFIRMNKSALKKHPLRRAGLRTVADAMGLTSEGVRKWTLKNEVPPEHLAEAVRLTKTPPSLLAPELYRLIAEADAAWVAAKNN